MLNKLKHLIEIQWDASLCSADNDIPKTRCFSYTSYAVPPSNAFKPAAAWYPIVSVVRFCALRAQNRTTKGDTVPLCRRLDRRLC